MISWKEVEEQLVEAVRLSWRLPGGGLGGRSSFASDGPWHLLTKLTRASAGASYRPGSAEWEAWRNEIDVQQLRDLRNSPATVPLTAREVAWVEARFAWLLIVPERDRRLVVVALEHIAAAEAAGRRVSWRRIRARLEQNRHWRQVAITDKGLGRRYSRAIQGIAVELNAQQDSAAHQPCCPAA